MSEPDEVLAICKMMYQLNGKLDFQHMEMLAMAGKLMSFEIWKSGWDPKSNDEDDA